MLQVFLLLFLDNSFMYTASFIQNPYPVYTDKLSLQGDIYWDEQYHLWCIMGYELACEALTDQRLSSETSSYLLETTFPRHQRIIAEPLIDYFKQWLFYHDPPAHTHLRKRISHAFSQQAVARYESIVSDVVESVCASLSGECDFVMQVAEVIPARVMARFLSLPEEDAALYVQWTLALSHFMDCLLRTPHEYQPALAALNEQKTYFSTLKNEWVSPETHWTLLPMLLGTGIETTITFLANGLYVLLKHPEKWRQLQQQPELLDPAIDEVLRLEPPVHKTMRRAIVEFSYQHCDIKKDDMVAIFLASANRDPRIFTNPHEFNIYRESKLNLSFGYGVHYCLGRLLGRLVARHCFRYILQKWPTIQLQEDSVSWHMGTTLRRLESLRVVMSD